MWAKEFLFGREPFSIFSSAQFYIEVSYTYLA